LKDDGIGSEDNLLERETESLGTTLIKSLASQVNAIVTYSGINGAKYEVTIPKDQD
jgi:two-component sensor histidine kinase